MNILVGGLEVAVGGVILAGTWCMGRATLHRHRQERLQCAALDVAVNDGIEPASFAINRARVERQDAIRPTLHAALAVAYERAIRVGLTDRAALAIGQRLDRAAIVLHRRAAIRALPAGSWWADAMKAQHGLGPAVPPSPNRRVIEGRVINPERSIR